MVRSLAQPPPTPLHIHSLIMRTSRNEKTIPPPPVSFCAISAPEPPSHRPGTRNRSPPPEFRRTTLPGPFAHVYVDANRISFGKPPAREDVEDFLVAGRFKYFHYGPLPLT